MFENAKLKKSNDVLEKKIQTLEEGLIQTSKTYESSLVEKLREEVTCLTKDFEKFWKAQTP